MRARLILYNLVLVVLISFITRNNGEIWDDIWGDVESIYSDAAETVRFVRDMKALNIAGGVSNLLIDVPETVRFVRLMKTLDISGGINNLVTDIPAMTTFVNQIKNLDFASGVDNLLIDVPEIVAFVRDFNIEPQDILMILEGVNQLIEELPKIALQLANQTLFKIKDRIDSDVDALSETLQTCFNNIKSIASDFGILDEQSNLANELEVTATLFQELATFLLPMKTQIEFVCNGKAEQLITIFIQMMEQSIGISDPPAAAPEPECDTEGYCKAVEPSYPYGPYYDLLTFPLTIDLFSGDDIPEVIADIQSYTDSNSFSQLKFILSILKEVEYWTGNICEIFTECSDPYQIISCASISICTVIIKPLGSLVHVVEHLLEVADIHDGMIETAQINTLFIDRESVIGNQFALRDDISDIKQYLNVRLSAIESHIGMTPTKSVILDTANTDVDGASVTLDVSGEATVSNNEWVINRDSSTTQSALPMVVRLTNKWGFSSTKKSILTFTIYGTSPVSSWDSDIMLYFSVDSKEYWSSLHNMDNVFTNRIYPQCDTSSHPTAGLASVVDIASMSAGGGYWQPVYPISGDDNAWPLVFKIENDPVADTMFASVTNPHRIDIQQCGFGQAFTPMRGLDIYINSDVNDYEPIRIAKFEIKLELAGPGTSGARINNGAYDSNFYYFVGLIFIISLVICNSSIYMIMKLKHSAYKSVSVFGDESEADLQPLK